MKNLVIVYNGREGSSAIISSLGKHSKVKVPIFEQLDYRNVKKNFGQEAVGNIHVALGHLLNGCSFDGRVFDKNSQRSNRFSVVFKWRPYGDANKVADVFLRTGTTICLLARKDLVNLALSKYYTNVILGDDKPVYHPQFEIKKMSPHEKKRYLEVVRESSFSVELNKLIQIIEDTVSSKKVLLEKVERMKCLGVKAKNVFYEDFLERNVDVLSSLLSEIGLSFEESVRKSDFEKVNRTDIRCQVENISDVVSSTEINDLVSEYESLFQRE